MNFHIIKVPFIFSQKVYHITKGVEESDSSQKPINHTQIVRNTLVNQAEGMIADMSLLTIFDAGIPIITFSSVVIIATTSYYILRKTGTMNSKLNLLLFGTLTTIYLWIITIFFMIVVINEKENLLLFGFVQSLGNLLIMIGLVFLAVFTNLLIRPTVTLRRFSSFVAIISLNLGLFIADIIVTLDNNFSLHVTMSIVSDIINLIFLITLLILLNQDVRILLREDLTSTQRKQVNYLQYAFTFGFGGNIPIIALSNIISEKILVLSFIITTLSVILIIKAYVIDPRLVHILPSKTYTALVVDMGGILKYNLNFGINRPKEDNYLFSGALSAITTLMSDFFKTEMKPQIIQYENKLILFSWAKYYFIAVVSDFDSTVIRDAIRTTRAMIDLQFSPDDFTGLTPLDLDQIFDQSFNFIY